VTVGDSWWQLVTVGDSWCILETSQYLQGLGPGLGQSILTTAGKLTQKWRKINMFPTSVTGIHRMLGRQAQLPDSLLPSFQEASWKYQLVTYGHMQFIHGQSMSISWKQWSYTVWLGTAIIYKYQFCCVSTWPSWNCLDMSAKQLFPPYEAIFHQWNLGCCELHHT